jgi:Common central domain of tyrosinase
VITGPADTRGMGLLEQYPHNLVHDWVGSRYGQNRDMGTLRCASLDPIFYLHHANVDRIWSLYPYQPDPPDEWYKPWFNFMDVGGKLASVTVNDTVTNMGNIRYLKPQAEGARKSYDLLAAAVAGLPKKPMKAQSAIVVEKVTTITNKPVDIAVPEPAAKLMAVRQSGDKAPVRSLLEFEAEGLSYAGKFYVRVFVNKPDADNDTSVEDEHFLGLFGALDSHAGLPAKDDKTVYVFRVSVSKEVSPFYKLVPPGKAFTLNLVPVGSRSSLKDFRLTVKKVSLKVYA